MSPRIENSPDVFRKALELPWVETIMFPYNFAEDQGEALIAACKEKNIGFICMKPLAGGALEDASLALRFVCGNDNVTIAIPGMATLEEAEQNFAAVCNKEPFTEAEKAEMARVAKELGNNFCRRCNYCAPCTAGIGISPKAKPPAIALVAASARPGAPIISPSGKC